MESATEEAAPAPRPQPQPQPSPPPDETSPAQPTQTEPTPDPSGTTASPHQSPVSSPKSRPVSGVVPPYWQRHSRNASRASQSSQARSTLITLEDHTADPDSETTRGLWARSVSIDDHVVVQGKTGVGAYVVWNCRIQTLDVSQCRAWIITRIQF